MATPGELELGALRDWASVAARVSVGPAPAAAQRPVWRAVLALAARTALLAVLPFFVLIRGSVLLYSRDHWTTWAARVRSEEHTSELQSRPHLVCRLLLEKKKTRPYSAR